MANIELVIKIPEEIYQNYKRVWQKRRGSIPESCIAFGTPLPKGHGDLIDRKDLIENAYTKGFCSWYDEIKMADTIIEADKAESEDKEIKNEN